MGRGGASRGGSGSTGGRSFGGSGGNRSFGGRSGSSGFNRGGVNSGGSSRGAGNSSGGYRPPRRDTGGMGPAIFGYSLGRMQGSRRPRRSFFRGGSGCSTVIIVLIFTIVLISLFANNTSPRQNNGSSNGNVTASTVKREALPAGAVTETDYYTDELDWIGNRTTLTSGMKNFYKKTGVQPYLYLTDTIDGTHSPSEAQVEQFAYETYDSLFSDEAHLLLIFFEYGDTYHTWYMAGNQAKTVLDQEAMDILLDYIDKYYYDQSMTDEQMFSKSFDEAGNRIMAVTTSPWIPVLIIAGVVAILIIAFFWWRSYKKNKNLEAEQTEKILNTPLESFGKDEAEERSKKY